MISATDLQVMHDQMIGPVDSFCSDLIREKHVERTRPCDHRFHAIITDVRRIHCDSVHVATALNDMAHEWLSAFAIFLRENINPSWLQRNNVALPPEPRILT